MNSSSAPYLTDPEAISTQVKQLLEAEDKSIQSQSHPELVWYCVNDFVKMDIPPREYLLHPWFPRQGLSMLYAARGVGKTYLAVLVAHIVATGGSLLGWSAPKPIPVLYIDGELPERDFQDRMLGIGKGLGVHPHNLKIVTPDHQHNGMPDLGTYRGQQVVDHLIDHLDVELIILDSLSCLVRSGRENDADGWQVIQDWLLRLRSRKKSVLLIHHAGKDGSQRGTSKREDILDTSIELKRSSDYSPEDGAQFELHFAKSRGFYGPGARPCKMTMIEKDGVITWSGSDLDEDTYSKVVSLAKEDLKQNEIAEIIGVDPSRVSRHIARARACGDLSPKRK